MASGTEPLIPMHRKIFADNFARFMHTIHIAAKPPASSYKLESALLQKLSVG